MSGHGSRPGAGTVEALDQELSNRARAQQARNRDREAQARSHRKRKKERRPDAAAGLKVSIHKLPGHTKKGLLDNPFYFQMPPTETFRRSKSHTFNDFDTIQRGQFSRRGGVQLETFEFSSLFIDYDPGYAAYHYGTSESRDPPVIRHDGDFYVPPGGSPGANAFRRTQQALPPIDPLGWLDELRDIMDSGSPIRLYVGQVPLWGRWEIKGMPVTIRTLESEERAGEPDSRYYSLSLTQWRDMNLISRTRGLPAVVTIHEKGQRATWDSGDGQESLKDPDLAKLAKRFYRAPGKWKTIAAANKHLRGWSAHRDLVEYARRHGHGKKGAKTVKITVPELTRDTLRRTGTRPGADAFDVPLNTAPPIPSI